MTMRTALLAVAAVLGFLLGVVGMAYLLMWVFLWPLQLLASWLGVA